MALIELRNAGYRAGRNILLADLNWSWRPDENWLLLGTNGAGKSTFLRLIRGDIFPSPGMGQRLYDLDSTGLPGESPIGVRERIGLVSPDAYERYYRFGINLPARRIVFTGLTDSLLPLHEPGPAEVATVAAVLDRLGIADLADRPFLTLSRGQARKVLLARALISGPRLLLLDEFMSHLDAASRQALAGLLQDEVRRGLNVVLTSHRPDEAPDFLNRGVLLAGGRMIFSGAPDETSRRHHGQPQPAPRPAPAEEVAGTGVVLKLAGVEVRIDERPVLTGLDWTVRRGEQWAVVGANGAGKSTLLDLIYGRLHAMPGGVVEYFGGLRLAENGLDAESLHRRMGLVSDRFQTEYDAEATALEVAVSGLHDSIGLWRDAAPEELDAGRAVLALVGLDDLADRAFSSLSFGQKRRALLARALAGDPELLLLDEPCEGLDTATRQAFLELLDDIAAQGRTLIIVAHSPEDFPACINRVLTLHDGRARTQSWHCQMNH